jgi:predicted transcriptional regulator
MDIDNNSRINVDNVEVGKESKEIKLVDVAVTDENIALNMMVNFLTLAHKRGAFGIDESAKIWECIKMFQR